MIFEIIRDGCLACAQNQPDLALKQAELRREKFAKLTAPETWVNESLDPMAAVSGADCSSIPATEQLLARSLTSLGFSIRVTQCFRREGIETIGELTLKTAEEVSGWRNLGTTGFREIKTKLQGMGLSLQ